tara:strand:- start:333 stop:794 length:462 start_codon:yes stop_codon:yes gene_type:complete
MIVMFMTPKVGNMVDRLAILLAVFLSFFLMAPSYLSAYVICFGADGHIMLEINQDGQCGTQHNAKALSSLHQSSFVLDIDDHCGECFDVVVPVISSNYPYIGSTHEEIVEEPPKICSICVFPTYLVSTLTDHLFSIETRQSGPPDCQTVILRL